MKNSIFVCFILALILGASIQLEVHYSRPESLGKLRKDFKNQTYNLLFFLQENEEGKLGLLKSLESLFDKPVLVKNYMNVMPVDLQKIPEAKEEFGVSDSPFNFQLHIRDKKFEYPDFSEFLAKCSSERAFGEEIERFVVEVLDRLSHEVKSLSELDHLVKSHKKILIYIGSDNFRFAVFRQLSLQFPDQQFYHSFNKVQNYKIVRKYAEKALNDRDIMAVIKCESLITDFDDKLFLNTNQFYSLKSLIQFVDFEMYPKLREDDLAKHNVEYFVKSEDTHIMLFIHDGEKNAKDFDEFQKAVHSLPRKWIYATSDIQKPEWSYYKGIFEGEKVEWEADSIYMIHKNKDQEIEIVKFPDVITKPNITHFALELMRDKLGVSDEMIKIEEHEEKEIDEDLQSIKSYLEQLTSFNLFTFEAILSW